ncbi:hypothetical protein KSP24_09380 [Paenibacillus sp. AK121]|uniref:hypothetical protein n=1 Tax=Paenibacillus TaxID=44249 RepID=UPI001C22F6F3|nr:hypothetical protein [Paenibacillus sp. AK121]MBU9707135.1 hypothetical protein [Paenibacillus sp. AK121]MEE4566364.1 hypothetical protein [Paenibacillus polymyxa]
MENTSKETRMTEEVSEFIETWMHTSPSDQRVGEATQIYNYIMNRFDRTHWLALGAIYTFGFQEGRRTERARKQKNKQAIQVQRVSNEDISEPERLYVLQYQNKLKEQCLNILLAIVDDELYDKENIKADVIDIVKTLNELEAIFPLYKGVAL